MSEKYYCGVGSRKTPQSIQNIMTEVAQKLSERGFILRSGGAEGADKAFEKGAHRKHIYYASDATELSMSMASQFHPAWDSMKSYGKKLHGRNVFQVLGRTMDIPSEFLLCWTKDGCITHEERNISTGGTGTAISIACAYNVPVFNLKRREHLEEITKWLK